MTSRGEEVYRVLRDEIAQAILSPGSFLREEEIGSRLAVSRTPVRDALARLKADGLVEQLPGQVALVTAVDIERTIEVYQVRDAIETYVVQLAAASAARSLFDALANEYRRAELDPEELTVSRLIELGDRFDALLAAAVPNPLLHAPLNSSRAMLLRIRMQTRDDQERLRQAAGMRHRLAAAIAAGDPTAAGALSHRRIADSLQYAAKRLTDTALKATPFTPLT